MSQGLFRIRQLLSEIEGVQRQGKHLGESLQLPVPPRPAKLPISETPLAAPDTTAPSVTPRSSATVGLTLSEAVTLQLTLPSGEEVQIRRLSEGVEIVFADGKAFHIPFKTVA
jgi:hypothetical protein